MASLDGAKEDEARGVDEALLGAVAVPGRRSLDGVGPNLHRGTLEVEQVHLVETSVPELLHKAGDVVPIGRVGCWIWSVDNTGHLRG